MNIAVHYILVNYFSDEELKTFARSHISISTDFLLTVVDNGSNSPESLQQFCTLKGYRYLNPGKNLGYFGAAHHAVSTMQREFDFTIVSNFDLTFDPRGLMKWLHAFSHEKSIGCIGPDIEDLASGKPMNPMYQERISKWKMRLLLAVTSSYMLYTFYQFLYGLKRAQRIAQLEKKLVYALHGSFLAIHHSYFKAGGNLNHPGFLYGEELFLAEECRRLGLGMLFDPSLHISHEEHITTGKKKNKQHMRFEHQSLGAIYRRYFLKA